VASKPAPKGDGSPVRELAGQGGLAGVRFLPNEYFGLLASQDSRTQLTSLKSGQTNAKTLPLAAAE
jgi:hypothetical protein